MIPQISNLCARLRKDEAGVVTVEAVLWLPMFIFFFCAVVDLSFVFHKQAEAYRVVQDANRAFSVGRLGGTEETETWISERMGHVSSRAQVFTSVTDGVILTQVALPIEDLDATGMFGFLREYDVVVKSEHFLEY